jgi:hypothetical protein
LGSVSAQPLVPVAKMDVRAIWLSTEGGLPDGGGPDAASNRIERSNGLLQDLPGIGRTTRRPSAVCLSDQKRAQCDRKP